MRISGSALLDARQVRESRWPMRWDPIRSCSATEMPTWFSLFLREKKSQTSATLVFGANRPRRTLAISRFLTIFPLLERCPWDQFQRMLMERVPTTSSWKTSRPSSSKTSNTMELVLVSNCGRIWRTQGRYVRSLSKETVVKHIHDLGILTFLTRCLLSGGPGTGSNSEWH